MYIDPRSALRSFWRWLSRLIQTNEATRVAQAHRIDASENPRHHRRLPKLERHLWDCRVNPSTTCQCNNRRPSCATRCRRFACQRARCHPYHRLHRLHAADASPGLRPRRHRAAAASPGRLHPRSHRRCAGSSARKRLQKPKPPSNWSTPRRAAATSTCSRSRRSSGPTQLRHGRQSSSRRYGEPTRRVGDLSSST